jgi:hypothetical protein
MPSKGASLKTTKDGGTSILPLIKNMQGQVSFLFLLIYCLLIYLSIYHLSVHLPILPSICPSIHTPNHPSPLKLDFRKEKVNQACELTHPLKF